MATPLSADKFLTALKAEGLKVTERSGWKTHNRNHMGAWGPVHGVMMHHTGPYSTESAMVTLCRNGYSGLPGPLCHGVIDRAGTIHLVGYGRANHAGLGDDDVLDAVIAETKLPADNEANTDGNARFYGFEAINKGDGQAWPDAQVEAMVRVSAAICRAHGWNAASVLAHKEWQPGKPDPAGVDMVKFRAAVAERLAHPASWNPDEEDEDMALTDADISKIATAVAVKLIAGGGVLEASDVSRVADAVSTTLSPSITAVAAQAKVNGESLTKIQIALADPTAPAAALKAAVETAIKSINVTFKTGE